MGDTLFCIGMAKTLLHLNSPGSVRNLELDVLRTIMCIEKMTFKNQNVQGYILIYDNDIKKRIENLWLPKYSFECRERLIIETFIDKLPIDVLDKIRVEKGRNSEGTDRSADYSKTLTEELLNNIILSNLTSNGYKLLGKDKKDFLVNVDWDFYGRFEKKGST
jgi:hypothetical protein